jgi:methionyl-tRNA formyltransferase
VPAHGCVNIHPSLLPLFKGVDPVLQAGLAGARIGVSVHLMTALLDSGPILAQRAVGISDGATIFAATALLFHEGARLLVTVIDQVAHRQAGVPQNEPGSYQSWPSRADIHALHRHGGALIRWSDLKGIYGA